MVRPHRRLTAPVGLLSGVGLLAVVRDELLLLTAQEALKIMPFLRGKLGPVVGNQVIRFAFIETGVLYLFFHFCSLLMISANFFRPSAIQSPTVDDGTPS